MSEIKGLVEFPSSNNNQGSPLNNLGETITITLNHPPPGMEEEGRRDKMTTTTTAVEPMPVLLTVAGPTTNPVALTKRNQVLKPQKFRDEPLHLECEWLECTFKSGIMEAFMDHVGSHVPTVEVLLEEDFQVMKVILSCGWNQCPFQAETTEDIKRHLFLHAYHTKLKCIGLNTLKRCDLNDCTADPNNRNIIPDLSADLACAWAKCKQKFTNIILYYNHIGDHVDATPRGKNVPGGIRCLWRGCGNIFANAVKLRDHMRSHTQEKLLACPNCGGLFSNRSRFFDHCRRQVLLEEETFACDVCMKYFSTARLLRDHIRAHVNTYKCHLCEMTCSSPSALNTHMRYKHSNDKPFKCQFCPYASKSYNDLVRHSRIHSNTTYKCDDCSFQCKAITTLKSHWAKEHGEGKSKYACHLCDKKFLKGNYLTKHLIAVHSLQWPEGHTRFRYKLAEDGNLKLLTVRYESVMEVDDQ